jgi:hypothetical protein
MDMRMKKEKEYSRWRCAGDVLQMPLREKKERIKMMCNTFQY